jgi:predicted Zn-dependent peptidase
LQAIASTTPADVQRVARVYLGNPSIALVLPREESTQNN